MRDDTVACELPPGGVAQWRLTRRCALTPRQTMAAYCSVVAACSVAAAIFGSMGYLLVPLFCLAEIVAAGAMYLSYMNHAIDGERIVLNEDANLFVEVNRGRRVRTCLMSGAWARLEWDGVHHDRLWICCGRSRVEVGTQLSHLQRRTVARELRNALAAQRAGRPVGAYLWSGAANAAPTT